MDMADYDLDEMHPRALIGAEQLRAVYAQRFAGDVEGQWHAWLHVAMRREMSIQRVQRHLQRPAVWSTMPPPAKAVARQALALIQKSEGLHASFIEDLLAGGRAEGRSFTADLMIWIADHEENLLSPLEQRAATDTDGARLFAISATFEAIVRQAYAQIETVARVLEDLAVDRKLVGLSREFHVRAIDRAFYERVFNELAHWVSRPAAERPTRRICAARLAGLLPREVNGANSRDAGVVTDGGLATLFARHRVPIVWS